MFTVGIFRLPVYRLARKIDKLMLRADVDDEIAEFSSKGQFVQVCAGFKTNDFSITNFCMKSSNLLF